MASRIVPSHGQDLWCCEQRECEILFMCYVEKGGQHVRLFLLLPKILVGMENRK